MTQMNTFKKMLQNKKKRPAMTKPVLLRNVKVTFICLATATLSSSVFFLLSHNAANAAIIYVLATVLVARNTEGYVPGIFASLFSVAFINYIFTYPYMALNFTLDGYPITFVGMTIISSVTSTLTTHLKDQTQTLNEREHMLMEAEKEKMRANLLRAISHDLRTPLTSIIGSASSYLEQGALLTDSDKSHLVETISDDAQWLLHMVENLLSVTRINDQTASVKTIPEPLEEVVSSALQRFHKRLPDARVHVQIPADFIMIPMDATLIEQVLINLLENAVYHSGSSLPIDLSVELDRSQAYFHVRDYGLGIQPDTLDTLFDGYTSTQNRSSDSHKGMGIGLSICRTIINAHHGQIFAANHSDGAELTFTLPLGENTYESEIESSDY